MTGEKDNGHHCIFGRCVAGRLAGRVNHGLQTFTTGGDAMTTPILIFVATVFIVMLLHTAWQGIMFVLTSPKATAVAGGVMAIGALIGCAMFGGMG